VLFLLTILLLLLFSSSFTFAFGETFNESIKIPFALLLLADGGGGGVEAFDDRTEDRGDAFTGDGFTKRSVKERKID
jgi:hypothetical protein